MGMWNESDIPGLLSFIFVQGVHPTDQSQMLSGFLFPSFSVPSCPCIITLILICLPFLLSPFPPPPGFVKRPLYNPFLRYPAPRLPFPSNCSLSSPIFYSTNITTDLTTNPIFLFKKRVEVENRTHAGFPSSILNSSNYYAKPFFKLPRSKLSPCPFISSFPQRFSRVRHTRFFFFTFLLV